LQSTEPVHLNHLCAALLKKGVARRIPDAISSNQRVAIADYEVLCRFFR
jgi:hypothetical protein